MLLTRFVIMGLFSLEKDPVQYDYEVYRVPWPHQVMREIVEDKIAQRREKKKSRRKEEQEWQRRQEMDLMQRRQDTRQEINVYTEELMRKNIEQLGNLNLNEQVRKNTLGNQLDERPFRRRLTPRRTNKNFALLQEELNRPFILPRSTQFPHEQVRKNTLAHRQVDERPSRHRPTPKKITKNLPLLQELSKAFSMPPLTQFPRIPYTQKILLESSQEFQDVRKQFRKNNRKFNIDSIVKIDNVFLLLQYKLTFRKYLRNNDHAYKENLFHGTKQEYVDSICTFNFDRSKVNTHKFGWGVSFAVESFYATFYHRANKKKMDKVMILADVIMESEELGSPNLTVPSSSYTSTNEQGSVIVKYDDSSFYPAYVVYYRGLHFKPQKKGPRRPV